MAGKLTKAAGLAIGSGALAVAPGASEAAVITEFSINGGNNDEPAGANVPAANTFDTITGSVRDGSTDVDQFNYQGLPVGSFFDIFVELDQTSGHFGDSINAAALDNNNDPTSGGINTLQLVNTPGSVSGHLTGLVPSGGEVRVVLSTGDSLNEDYRITLAPIAAAVPVPASVALVAAGLVGLGGLHVARRKRVA